MKIKETQIPDSVKHIFIPGATVYYTDTGCSIILAKEMGLWHLSISHPDRNPTWEEIHQVRYDLMPRDRDMAMILPPVENYVNIHEYCFHIWEMKRDGIMTKGNAAVLVPNLNAAQAPLPNQIIIEEYMEGKTV